MADYRAFGATNEPLTCRWCGKKLRKKFRRKWVGTGTKPAGSSDPWGPKEFVGYGDYADGFFCGLRCGYQFGVSLASHGRRLKPIDS